MTIDKYIRLSGRKDNLESKEGLNPVDDSILFKKTNPSNGSDEQFKRGFEEMKKFFDFISGKKKTKNIINKEEKDYYNVYVYQEQPYPPDSIFHKNVKLNL
jgi:hypothetical protein